MKKTILISIGFLFCVIIFPVLFYGIISDETICFIESDNGEVRLTTEIADTPEKQVLGLMFRKTLPDDRGMLFLFNQPKRGSMWMKNTYIPLDMLFFNQRREIVHIHENAVPQDETIITTPMPVSGVIEVNAGFAKKNQIRIGHHITLPSFKEP